MQAAIGYLRVSTPEQGRSGLSLAAQSNEIEAFGARKGFSIKSWHRDVQTGKGSDALRRRPGLTAALEEARAARCPLIVSRLDRLSRNVHFISGLMEHRVHFIVAAFGIVCDNLLLHVHASVAEHERKLISERCRAAAAVLKQRGYKFGLARSKALRRRIIPLGLAAIQKATMERSEACRLYIEWALRQPGVKGRPITFKDAAEMLNDRKIKSCTGGRWLGPRLKIMSLRLGIRHPHRIPPSAARAAVRTILKQDPEASTPQVLATLRRDYVVSTGRVQAWVTDFRRGAAKRNPTYKRVGWRIDYYTPARLRVSRIWKRHPEFTAQQVFEELGSRYKKDFVKTILRQCWAAHGRYSREQLRVGRRALGSWRGR